MTQAAHKTTPLTLEQFLAWYQQQPGRYEFADGEVIAMAPGRVRHGVTKGEVFVALRDAVKKAKLPCVVFPDGIGVAIEGRNWREPDAVVHCGPTLDPEAIMAERPVVLVEVVSPSSERDDTRAKLVEYFTIDSVMHYLIVDPYDRLVIHHARAAEGKILTAIVRTGTLALDPPGILVDIADLLPVVPEPAESRQE
jgi:Uma2 family endonuclease